MDYFTLAVFLVVAASGIWVYMDAAKNKIGKISGKGGLLNLSAGALAGATLLLWIVTLPLYLIKRKSLIEQAKESPQEPAGKVALGICGVIFVAIAAASISATTLPACDSTETLQLANQVIHDSPVLKLLAVDLGLIQNPAEQNFENGKRICRGFVRNPVGGQMAVNYSVSWHDKAKRVIYVEILADQALAATTALAQTQRYSEPTNAANASSDSRSLEGEKAVTTRFGGLRIAEQDKLLFNERPLAREVFGVAGLNFKALFQLKAADVVLVQETGGSGCPAMFYLVTLNASGAKLSQSFGTCSEFVKPERLGDELFIHMPGVPGAYGPNTFQYRAGVLTNMGEPK